MVPIQSQVSELGHEIDKTKKYQEVADSISLTYMSFSESEKEYIDNF